MHVFLIEPPYCGGKWRGLVNPPARFCYSHTRRLLGYTIIGVKASCLRWWVTYNFLHWVFFFYRNYNQNAVGWTPAVKSLIPDNLISTVSIQYCPYKIIRILRKKKPNLQWLKQIQQHMSGFSVRYMCRKTRHVPLHLLQLWQICISWFILFLGQCT